MEQISEIITKLAETLTSLGLPVAEIEAFFGELIGKITEILGSIIGGIGG